MSNDTRDLSPTWEFVGDGVMGGVSSGSLSQQDYLGRRAAVLRGTVSLDNNGGFVQMAFDLQTGGGTLDASAWSGLELDVAGNTERYDVRLRTDQLTRPWQSFRTEIMASRDWQTVRLPFTIFASHKTEAVFDPARLRRVGVLAIGRVFEAQIAVSAVRLFR